MTRRFFVRAAAEADITEAVDWYENQQSGLGHELLDKVRETIAAIRTRPESFPIDYRDARRALVHRFPYAIHFVVRPNLVAAIAVLHTRQDKTQRLKNRLE